MITTKFRGLTKANNVMVYGDLITCPNGNHRIIWFEMKSEFLYKDFNEPIQSSTIGQFSGLKDVKGLDIYEGDILEFKNRYGKYDLHKVFRVNGGLAINSHANDINKKNNPFYSACADMQTAQWIEQCSVIGNIYINPELLSNG